MFRQVDYVKAYDKAASVARDAARKYPLFAAFLRASSSLHDGHTLADFLIVPVQRIPRYLLLLQKLRKHTPPNHRDFQNTVDALDQMR